MAQCFQASCRPFSAAPSAIKARKSRQGVVGTVIPPDSAAPISPRCGSVVAEPFTILRAAALGKESKEAGALHSTLLGLTAAAATLALGVGPSFAEPKLPPLDKGVGTAEQAGIVVHYI
jgi:hypothetical protein